MKKKLISLFTGCGGMDLGFEGGFPVFSESLDEKHKNWVRKDYGKTVLLENNDFELVMANDIDNKFKNVWLSHFSNIYNNADEMYKIESIVDIVKKAQKGEIFLPQNIDVVTGGFPCQDFSNAGKRQGFKAEKNHLGKKDDYEKNENRGMLYYWLKEFISIVDPKVFVAENVKGLTTIEGALETIKEDFANINDGFAIAPVKVLNAKYYGVPQNRERVIFLGFNKKYIKSKKIIEDIEKGKIDVYPKKYNFIVPAKYVLQDLEEPNSSKDLSQKSYSKAKLNKGQGNRTIDHNNVSPTIRAEHHGNIEFRYLNFDNPNETRRLSVRECARIQTFPDSFEFVTEKSSNNYVSASVAYKTVGNAVPPLLGYHIAKKLDYVWDDIFESNPNESLWQKVWDWINKIFK